MAVGSTVQVDKAKKPPAIKRGAFSFTKLLLKTELWC
jgi:hypothetical protein